jgi:hypothetical protein
MMSRRFWDSMSAEARRAWGRRLAEARAAKRKTKPTESHARVQDEASHTRVRVQEVPQSWLDAFVAREVERTGCSKEEARKRGIQYWEED